MAHTKYTTPAVVVGRLPMGEGNATIILFTRDFGLVHAAAKSIREHRSRLRYSVQVGMHIDASLVRGRYEWRLVSAREAHALSPVLLRNARLHRARVIRLIRRLVKGEERNDALYDVVLQSLDAASLPQTLLDWQGLEVLSAAKIMHTLGYLSVGNLPKSVEVLFQEPITTEALSKAYTHRSVMVEAVNRALAVSQL